MHPKIEKLFHQKIPKFPLGGVDVINEGVHEGQFIGHVLNKVEDWWIHQDYKPNKDKCTKKMKQILFAVERARADGY